MTGLLEHLNTRLKLFEKVSLLLVIMVLVATLNIGVIYTYHQQAEQIGNSVNVAGQERMLSQRMARLATAVSHSENPDQARARLRIASERFQRNLAALESGGTVRDQSLNPDADGTAARPQVVLRGETLSPAPAALEPELASLRDTWEPFQTDVETILTADRESAAFRSALESINDRSDTLLARSDAVTAEFADVLQERRAILVQALLILLAVDVGVAIVGTLAARRYLGLPMADIARVGDRLARGEIEPAGELGLPLDESLRPHQQRSELAQLSASFEAVQSYHETAAKQARALARRNFDDPVLDEQIPGQLGQSLNEMQSDLPTYIEDLRTTTEQLDALISASPVGIMITGPNGEIKRWNPAAEETFGWSQDEVAGEPNPAVPDADHDQFQDLLSTAIVDGQISSQELQWRTKSGDPIDVSLSMAPVPGSDDTLEGVMIVAEDITDRKDRERTLEQRHEELQTLNEVANLIFAITQALIESSDQERIESVVCQSLLDSELYESAGILERRGEGTYAVRIDPAMEHDAAEAKLDAGSPVYDVVSTAFEDGHVSTTQCGGQCYPGNPWEEPREVTAVPLAYREAVFGVLLVTTRREFPFRERERSALATLGRTVGFAIDAITDKKLLFADTVVQLTFDVSETDFPFVAASEACGCSITLDGLVAGTEATTIDAYLRVEGTTEAVIRDALAETPGVTAVSLVATEGEQYRLQVTLAKGTIFHELGPRPGRIHGIDLQDGRGTYTIEVPRTADVETVVDLVKTVDPNADFVAKTEHERQAGLDVDTRESVRDRFTDRQYEVLKTAYFAGYFEWPRQSTIEDIAADLDLAGSTVNHHLRHAQLRLVEYVFQARHIDG